MPSGWKAASGEPTDGAAGGGDPTGGEPMGKDADGEPTGEAAGGEPSGGGDVVAPVGAKTVCVVTGRAGRDRQAPNRVRRRAQSEHGERRPRARC